MIKALVILLLIVAGVVGQGNNWMNGGQQFSQAAIYSITNVGNGAVLAGTGNGGLIIRSTDYGATWDSLGQQYSQSYIHTIKYVGNGYTIAGTGNTTGNILYDYFEHVLTPSCDTITINSTINPCTGAPNIINTIIDACGHSLVY